MMSRFDECLSFVLAKEGGYSNHPQDRGGATNRGLTQQTYDAWRINKGLSRSPVSGISMQEVRAIYEQRYWLPVASDKLPAPLDLVVFDAAVQHGTSKAAKWLQRVVEANQDGFIGRVTVAKVAQEIDLRGVKALVYDFMAMREEFYDAIIERDPSQQVFAKGWDNRMADLGNCVKEFV
jgi:lysozyme family protein